MKKIFAIALALVMVFSMASAFALNDCSTGFDWSCPASYTECGKAKVEVVPYVKVNNGCGGFDWQVSDCATAINTENVYFAIKLTVDAYVDMEWLDVATLTIETEGLEVEIPEWDALEVEEGDDEAQVFYLSMGGAWFDASAKGFDVDDVMWTALVEDADDAEVCATIASEHDGYGEWTYGDYTVVASKTDAKNGTLTVTGDCGEEFVMTWEKGKVSKIEASASFLAEVQSVFSLSGCVIGTCVEDEIIQRNFGWDDEFENCFAWSNKGAAVVNPECVVAIPKTGDVSVVAYAVMAVVAAAGAMLKK